MSNRFSEFGKRVSYLFSIVQAHNAIVFLKLFLEIWNRQQVTIRAAALTYTSFLSVVPSLAVLIAGVAWVANLGQIPDSVHNFLIETLPADASFVILQYSDFSNISETLKTFVLSTFASGVGDSVVGKLDGFIGNVKFDSIGYAGFFSLLITAVLLLFAIEKTMNKIWCVPREKAWSERLFLYCSALSFTPLLLSLIFTSSTLLAPLFPNLVPAAKFSSAFATFIFLTVTFTTFPNTKVRLKNAAIGALVGTVGLELLKIGFGIYTRKALLYNTLYGSLAALPFFLIWLYAAWIIFIVGTIVAFVAQNMKYRKQLGSLGQWDPETIFDKEKAHLVLELIHSLREKSLTYKQMRTQVRMPDFALHNALEWLRRKKWINRRRIGFRRVFYLDDQARKSTDAELWMQILGVTNKDIQNDKIWDQFVNRDTISP